MLCWCNCSFNNPLELSASTGLLETPLHSPPLLPEFTLASVSPLILPIQLLRLLQLLSSFTVKKLTSAYLLVTTPSFQLHFSPPSYTQIIQNLPIKHKQREYGTVVAFTGLRPSNLRFTLGVLSLESSAHDIVCCETWVRFSLLPFLFVDRG